MTRLETANQPKPHRKNAMDRIGKWVAEKGWAHLLLLVFVGIFLFPFLWMVGMSIKTDEEATSTDVFPSIPSFRADCPSVRKPHSVDVPPNLSSGEWKDIREQLLSLGHAKLRTAPLPIGGDSVDSGSLRDAAADDLIYESTQKLPEEVWKKGEKEIETAFNAMLTPEEITQSLDDSLGKLSFYSLQVRSLDTQIRNIVSGPDIATNWKVESGPAKLRADKDAALLEYHFKSSGDEPIVLRADFDMPVPMSQLHKIIVGMKGDDSWHHIDAALDVEGQRWETSLTTYIAQYRASSILFQPPGFDDTTYQAHVWVPLKKDGTSTNTGKTATLRLTIRPSGTFGAIYGKIQRNYLRAFRAVPFWTYLVNSVLLVALTLGGAIFSSAFVAYAFARLRWPGRALAFGLLLSTMMLPEQVTMIPSFVIWRSLGWYNTLNPLWISSWTGSAFFIFLMTQNMKTIPKEMEEAARIDGLNAVQTWWYIILPLVKPTLAAIAIMTFQGAWNNFMGPLVYLRDQSKFPLSLGLFGLKLNQFGDWSLVMAGNMLMTLPVIIIFFLFQRYFIEGVTVSGMKG